MKEAKAALRREVKARIAALDGTYIAESDAGIMENVLSMPEFAAAGMVFAYLSVDRECDTRQIVEKLLAEGRVRAIGVCNFLPDRLVDLILTHSVVPAVNQIELHPFCQQQALRQVMAAYHIQPMAWAPFAEGQGNLFHHPVLSAIGQAHGKTPAQVVLRWLRQEGIVAIPKSVHPQRIRENWDIEDFTLSPGELTQIRALDQNRSWILDVPNLTEVYRLHNIPVSQ